MNKFSNIQTLLGYTVAAVTSIFGIVLISGIAFGYVPKNLRLTFGVVLILWGIYRFVLTRIRIRQQSEESEEEMEER